MIKAGILGVGTIGLLHIEQAYKESEDIKLEAVFDLSEENLKKYENLRTYNNLDTFLENEAGKLDFVDICLPTYLHKEITIKALEKGFNVICEKPMALSVEDTKEMCLASEKCGKKLMVAHVLRFSKDFQIIKEHIEKKTLGNLRNVKYTTYRDTVPAGVNGWFKKKNLSGGPIFDVHIHDTDLLLYLLGKPKKLSTIANNENESDGINSFVTNALYDNNLILNIQCDFGLSKIKHDEGRSLRLNFEKGYIIKNDNFFVMVDENGKETDLATGEDLLEAFYKEVKYFADAIENNKGLDLCLPEDSSEAIKFVCLEIESAENGGEFIEF